MNISSNYITTVNHNIYTANGVSNAFRNSAVRTAERLKAFSPKAKAAADKLENIIILSDANSTMPEEFKKTETKFHKYAEDAYGFVSKADNAIVLVEKNHGRKNAALEGTIAEQAEDTFTHETGHLIDDEYSTTDAFKQAYLRDLKNIDGLLDDPNSKICGEDTLEMVNYLHHYMEGVNFQDGIDESDITREGLRENFAECFSTLADSHPTKINEIYAALFPNTMKTTLEFVI